ncbi:hypothetical protein BGZ83_008552 [Gryganskiella cystojenkinii]|nr:hypothetical protein BGZ83_008552 [Gryganskiella cystojenkinii]
MDYRQWARNQDSLPAEPWPLPYKRELAKLKSQRLEEFRNTMDVNFGWLQDYYEGFRWAAMQRQCATMDHSTMGFTERVDPTRRQRQLLSDDIDHSYGMDYNSGLKTPTQTYHRGSYLKSSGSMQGQFHGARQRPTAEHFHLKTPKTPRGMAALRSPRSPFERHRFTSRRSRLRVNTSASARKLSRSHKTMRKKSHDPVVRSDEDPNSHRSSVSTGQGAAQDQEIHPKASTTISHPTTVIQKELPRSSLNVSNRQAAEGTTTEDGTTQQDRTSAGWGFPGDKDKTPKEDDEDEDTSSFHTTPGSKARDSMQLFSPPMRLSADRDSDYDTPGLSRERLASSRPSLFKRANSYMDFDQAINIEEAEYKRPKSSPFLDSIAPVRFGSPERADRSASGPSKSSSESDRMVPSQSRTRYYSTASEPERRGIDELPTSSSHRNVTAVIKPRGQDELSVSRSTSTRQDGDEVSNDLVEIRRQASDELHRPVTEVAIYDERRTRNEPQPSRAMAEQADMEMNRTAQEMRDLPKGDRTFSRTSLLDLPKRTRVANALPEKRTIFQRSRLGQGPASQQQASVHATQTSRLTKTGSLSTQEAVISDLANSTTASASSTGAKLSRANSQSVLKDLKAAGSLGSVKAAPSFTATAATSVSSVLRQGVPRAPLPSMRPTESSLARSSTQSSLIRKPFQTSKTALSLKRPVRQVLPDSTLTAKSIALAPGSQSDLSKPARPPGSPKRERREMTPLETRLRELTPDVSAKPLLSSASGSTVSSLKETRSSSLLITGPLVSAQGNSKATSAVTLNLTSTTAAGNSSSSLAPSALSQGKKASQRLQDSLQQLIKSSKANFQTSNSTLTSLQPADRSYTNSSWNSSLRSSGRAKTVLPEIPSEPEEEFDDTPLMNGSSAPPPQEPDIPPWAQSEELERALRAQASINPQEIFGALPPLDISSMLPSGDRQQPQRLSSAQWGATDQLTTQEILKYNAAMGWSTGNE